MANRSKKGRAFEISICQQLSLWWSEGERDDIFWHTHSSGARATKRARKGKKTANSCGDIMALDPIGEPLLKLFCFELKRGYNRATIADLLDAPEKAAKQTYAKWFEQAEQSRKDSGALCWALIVQRDRREAIIYLPSYYKKVIGYSEWYCCHFWVHELSDSVVAVDLKSFLRDYSPDDIQIHQQRRKDEAFDQPPD